MSIYIYTYIVEISNFSYFSISIMRYYMFKLIISIGDFNLNKINYSYMLTDMLYANI